MKSLSLFAALSLAVAGMFAISGCTGKPADAPPKAGESHHDHPSEGPHHGQLIEFAGEKHHGELTHDDKTHTVTIYLLGGDAKSPAYSADPEITLNLVVDGKPQQAKLAAAPQEGESAEKCSRYTLVDEQVLEALENPKTTIRLRATIDGQSYDEEVKLEHDHGHDHK